MAEKKNYTTQDKINFIVSLYPAAREASRKTGMSWELILAQAAQETGWGEKVLPGSNNVFNIKAGASWKGDSKVYHVWEKQHGKKVWVDDAFRVYPSVAASLEDRMRLLQNSERYAKAGLLNEGVKGDLAKEAHALQKGGYATAENYAASMIELFHGPTMRRALAEARKAHPEAGAQAVAPTAQAVPAQPAPPQAPRQAETGAKPAAGADAGTRMVNATLAHFGDGSFEYGRADMAGRLASKKSGNRIDGSRYEQDLDNDGKKGVDCSSLVWRSLQLGGTRVTDKFPTAEGFTTHTLFNGGHGGKHPDANLTGYAKKHFDLIQSKDDLKPGDILMFKGEGGQHVAIYKGRNEKGEQLFFGSQTSTGPAEVNLSTNPYWAKQPLLGALRPKEEFFKPEALQAAHQQQAGLSAGKQSLLDQAIDRVKELQQRDGRLKDLGAHHIDNLGAALAVEGWKKGMAKAEAAVVNAADPGKISMLCKNAANKVQHAAVELKDAIVQAAHHSIAQLAAAPEAGQEPAKPQAQQAARSRQPAMGM
ncbi:glucosaminidase domain-containing protein [Chromobacterium sp. CV08]|uniref:glucosaminidase domain-containing protein n=1 Tax=Chromobacterium sp. CV08 TaxID=3133274 RepID=UPI003DA859D2